MSYIREYTYRVAEFMIENEMQKWMILNATSLSEERLKKIKEVMELREEKENQKLNSK